MLQRTARSRIGMSVGQTRPRAGVAVVKKTICKNIAPTCVVSVERRFLETEHGPGTIRGSLISDFTISSQHTQTRIFLVTEI